MAVLFLAILLGLASTSNCKSQSYKPYSNLYHAGGRRWLLEGARSYSQPGAGGHGLVVPLHPKHGVTRARGLLRNGTLPIIGAVREVG